MDIFDKSEDFTNFKYTCKNCHFKSNHKSHYNKHLQTKKHNTTNTTAEANKKRVFCYKCISCDFNSNNKLHYNKHLQTKKHNTTNTTAEASKSRKRDDEEFICPCGKSYLHRTSLYNHKKTCTKSSKNDNDNDNLIEIIKTLLIQNNEILEENNKKTDKIIELACKPTITNTNCNNTTTFNLNTFLNVDCKDAINFSEFINNIKVTMEDFENIHNNDPFYIYNKCCIQPLMLMDQSKRPIHCTDKKRKNFAVKDNNSWDRNKDSQQINVGIMRVMNESCKTMSNWKIINSDWNNSETKQDIINISTINIVKGYDNNLKNKFINKMCELTIDKLV